MSDETIFSDALAIVDPTERKAYLDRVCPDWQQRNSILDLLQAAQRKMYEAADEIADEKAKLRLAAKLLRKAEEIGDKIEMVRWRAEVAKPTPELAPQPREKR